jgi:hypothetical protein
MKGDPLHRLDGEFIESCDSKFEMRLFRILDLVVADAVRLWTNMMMVGMAAPATSSLGRRRADCPRAASQHRGRVPFLVLRSGLRFGFHGGG